MGSGTTISVSQVSDCLQLKRQHVTNTAAGRLDLWVGDDFMQSVNGAAAAETPDVWHSAFKHVLGTVVPKFMSVHCHINSGIKGDFTVNVNGETQYTAILNSENTSICMIK